MLAGLVFGVAFEDAFGDGAGMHCLAFGGPSCRLDLGRILGEVEAEVGRLGLAGVGQPSLVENLA